MTFAVGLALSGGGSRAIAFHRGTVRALGALGLIEAVDVVSTVSGGSVFGAGWMSAIADGKATADFLDDLLPVIERGFVVPAICSLRFLPVILGLRSRTQRLAQVFDEILTRGKKLGELPARPLLCLNTTVLNHGQVGRFSREGFSCLDLGHRDGQGGYPQVAVPVTLGFAAAASAAFPFGLPPVSLQSRTLGVPLTGALKGHRKIVLTDGGVLENLGVQTLLRSDRFGARDIVRSDAGTADQSWQPSWLGNLTNFAAFALTADTLAQLVSVMNTKQNRSMRELAVQEIGAVDPPEGGRCLLFVRIDQTWDRFVRDIPSHRLRQLGGGAGLPASDSVQAREAFLAKVGVDLAPAKQKFVAMGGEPAVARAVTVRPGPHLI